MQNRGKRTLIIVKRTLTEPKATWAGGIAQASLAIFRIWMSAFNVETARSRPFCCGVFVAIVEIRGIRKEMVMERECEEKLKP